MNMELKNKHIYEQFMRLVLHHAYEYFMDINNLLLRMIQLEIEFHMEYYYCKLKK